jgi:hypothetical protein
MIQISDETLIDELQRLADDLGHRPGTEDMQEHGEFGASTYHRRFGSWNAALEAADVETATPQNAAISDDTLLDELRRLTGELERRPGTRDMDKQGEFTSKTYSDRFGSWNAALEAAGLETTIPQHAVISDEALIDELQRLADDLERRPSESNMRENGEFSPGTYRNRFGSWGDALQELDSSVSSESESE